MEWNARIRKKFNLEGQQLLLRGGVEIGFDTGVKQLCILELESAPEEGSGKTHLDTKEFSFSNWET